MRRDEQLGEVEARRFADWIARRARREPAQYIAGRVEFHGLSLAIDRRALIPRPETEGLVDTVLATDPPAGATVLDAGTGSGCIAIALALARPDLALRAIDRSVEALELARENVRRHGVERRVLLLHAEFTSVPAEWESSFDRVVANPPYVPEGEWVALQAEVRDHEPREALVPGSTGLEAYVALAGMGRRVLRPGGAIVFEVGYNQAQRVCALLTDQGFASIEARADWAGIPRYVLARAGAAR